MPRVMMTIMIPPLLPGQHAWRSIRVSGPFGTSVSNSVRTSIASLATMGDSTSTGCTAAPGAPLDHFLTPLVRGAMLQDPPKKHGFSKHWKEHGKRRCPKCLWARRRKAWTRSTPVHPIHCPRTWIAVCPAKAKRWSIGCWVCQQIALVSPGTMESHGLGTWASCLVHQPSKPHAIQHQKSRSRATRTFLHLRCLTYRAHKTPSRLQV